MLFEISYGALIVVAMEEKLEMHIGLLEDNPSIQDFLQKVLVLNGHTVSVYTHGISLLDAVLPEHLTYNSHRYDLAIIDLNLPGKLSGWDVIVHIRKTISAEMLPIILISGAERGQLEHIHTLFPDIAIVQKPFKVDTLLQLLEANTVRQRKEVV